MRLHVVLILGFISFPSLCQTFNKENVFEEIIFKVDTTVYSIPKQLQLFRKEKYLFFKSNSNNDIGEITLIPKNEVNIESIVLQASPDFNQIDSIKFFTENYFKCKIKFNDLENIHSLALVFLVKLKDGKVFNYELKFFPYTITDFNYDKEPIDLFLDEEKVIEMPCLHVYNIKMDNDWQEYPEYDIKISPSINAIKLNIRPKVLGSKFFAFKLKTNKPFLNELNEITYDLPPAKIKFNVKPNRIDYINPDIFTIYYNQDYKSTEEMQFEFNRNMLIKKTYRIEDSQDNGGNLIAEIFTQSQIGNNNKIVGRIRTFGLHKMGDGYLYIKDGDKTRFITNFNIIEKPRIDDISILHDGQDWTNNLFVNPGEKIEIRIKGTGLQESTFQFEGIEKPVLDSTRLSDEVAFYSFKVPINIPKKKINVFMNKVSTQYSLLIREFQKPDDFDYILVNYEGKDIPLNDEFFDKPVFFEGNIKDVNFVFDPSKIDDANRLNGKQYVDIDVALFDKKNTLIEVQSLNNVVICPGSNSPRGSFYDLEDCKNETISLNDHLIHKTYAFDAFTQLIVTFKNTPGKYGNAGKVRKFKLILKKRYNLDVQVSFPAGLLTYKFNNQTAEGQSSIANFSGISIAFIAQFQFYDGNNVNKLKPYSFGAGFIAIDAFNFSQSNTSRDLGIVALGTLTPIQSSKLSFPLYLGGGYLVNAEKFFVLFGPGLRFSF